MKRGSQNLAIPFFILKKFLKYFSTDVKENESEEYISVNT